MGISFTRKTDYALVALAKIGEGSGDGHASSAREIAEVYDLPLPLLMNLLKDLQRAGIVSSRRGASGGYYLVRAPEQISLAAVAEAIEGPMKLTPCCEHDAHDACQACGLLDRCPISGSMRELHGMLLGFLRHVTLKDLLAGTVADRFRELQEEPVPQWADMGCLPASIHQTETGSDGAW